jgi:hypothetical protein
MSWQTFIEHARPGEHAVQIHADPHELVESVGRYLAAGFRSSDPAVVIATAEHRHLVLRELEQRGWDPADLQRQRLLTYVDAEETLDTFMREGSPDPEAFDRVVGGLIDAAGVLFPGQMLRAFGEMVDVLWSRGEQQAAIALEELWNELARSRSFALLCGYHLDIFDLDAQRKGLPEVFRAHSHARPAADPAWLAESVDMALRELAGARGAARAYLDAAEDLPTTGVPRAQAVLSRLSGTDPGLARQVLERARSHYAARSAAA